MRDRVGKSLRLEEWARGTSFLHRRDARGKILALLFFLVAVASTPPTRPLAFLPVSLVLALAVWVSALPAKELLLRASVIIPFPLFFGIVSWIENGNLAFAQAIVVRSYLSALGVLLLMGVTPLSELLRGLRGLGVPAVLVMILQSLVRYLHVIIDHGMRMRRAASCRDGGLVLRASRQSLWKRASGALAVLFGRSYARAEGVHRSMVARGFQGEFISPRPARFTLGDWVFVAGTGMGVTAARFLAQVRL